MQNDTVSYIKHFGVAYYSAKSRQNWAEARQRLTVVEEEVLGRKIKENMPQEKLIHISKSGGLFIIRYKGNISLFNKRILILIWEV